MPIIHLSPTPKTRERRWTAKRAVVERHDRRCADDLVLSTAQLLQHGNEKRLGELHRREGLQEDLLLSGTCRKFASRMDSAVELLLRQVAMQR